MMNKLKDFFYNTYYEIRLIPSRILNRILRILIRRRVKSFIEDTLYYHHHKWDIAQSHPARAHLEGELEGVARTLISLTGDYQSYKNIPVVWYNEKYKGF